MTRYCVLALLATTILLWTLAISSRASAHEPHPGLQFSIAIDGVPGCDTRHADATCELPIGSTFQLDVNLDSLPSDIPGYQGFDIVLLHSGVTPLQDASTTAWPDCGFPASHYGRDEEMNGDPEVVAFACAIGLPPAGPSTYTGLIGTNTFACNASGSITLMHGAGVNTDLVESVMDKGDETTSRSIIHSEGNGTTETINITCAEEPTPTSTPPPVLPTTGDPSRAGQAVPLWLIAALFGLAAIALAALATRLRRTT